MPLPQSLAAALMSYQQEAPVESADSPRLTGRVTPETPRNKGDDPFLEGNRFRQSKLEKRVYGNRKPELPGETNRAQRMHKDDIDAISRQNFDENATGFMGFAGNVVNTPSATARDVVVGKNPLSGVFDPSKRTTGRDIGEKLGVIGPNEDQGWLPDVGDLVGAGIEVGTDLGTGLGARMLGRAGTGLANMATAGKGDAFGGFSKDRINAILDARRKVTVVTLPYGDAASTAPSKIKINGDINGMEDALFEMIKDVSPNSTGVQKYGGQAKSFDNGQTLVVRNQYPDQLDDRYVRRHEVFHGLANAAKHNNDPRLPLGSRLVGALSASGNKHMKGVGEILNETLARTVDPARTKRELLKLYGNPSAHSMYGDVWRSNGAPAYQIKIYDAIGKGLRAAKTASPYLKPTMAGIGIGGGVLGGAVGLGNTISPLFMDHIEPADKDIRDTTQQNKHYDERLTNLEDDDILSKLFSK